MGNFIGKAGERFAEKGFAVLGPEEALACWSEGKGDNEKMHSCMAKTMSTWLAVFTSREGLKCLLDARDITGKIRDCKANGAASVTTNFLIGTSLAILLLVRAS